MLKSRKRLEDGKHRFNGLSILYIFYRYRGTSNIKHPLRLGIRQQEFPRGNTDYKSAL